MKRSKNPYLLLTAAVAALVLLALVLLGVLLHARRAQPEPSAEASAAPAAETHYAPPTADVSGVTALSFEKLSSTSLRLTWTADAPDARCRVMRRAASGGDWEARAELDAGTGAYTDTLDSAAPQQYLYRVDLVPDSGGDAVRGAAIPASNISVCIDPGHYLNSTVLTGEDMYGYGEGLFMLRLGLELRAVLLRDYGITAVMTRETDDITLGGWSNGELDSQHLTLRGTFAEGHDLFISLHTNANLNDANGYPTCNQPVGINKTLVFVNRPALASDTAMAQANAIGSRVTAVNAALGLTTTGDAFTAGKRDALITWSDAFNDSLDTPGTVCYRDGETHQDYYGVLRGAASVNVQGFIVEHGFHTVAEVRRAAMEGDLAQRWAEADAAGIAEGYGFVIPQN